jgi:hypothetical protein
MILEKLNQQVAASYQAKTGALPSVDIISTIIDTILSIINSCGNNTAIATSVKSSPVVAQVRVRQAMRKAGIYNRPDREMIVATIMEQGDTATEQDVASLQQEVNWAM